MKYTVYAKDAAAARQQFAGVAPDMAVLDVQREGRHFVAGYGEYTVKAVEIDGLLINPYSDYAGSSLDSYVYVGSEDTLINPDAVARKVMRGLRARALESP